MKNSVIKSIFYKAIALVLFLNLIQISIAQEVTLNEARLVAKNLMFEKAGIAQKSISVLSETPFEEDKQVFYYTFNLSNGGFVIISGDKKAYPILAYGFAGSLKANHSPAFEEWMQLYVEQIKLAKIQKAIEDKETTSQWKKYLADYSEFAPAKASKGIVGPLFGPDGDANSISYNQGGFYNDGCPGGSIVGCVATAMSMIMVYHDHPNVGLGYREYEHNIADGYQNDYGTLSADFGAKTYNIANLPPNLSSANADAAKLGYHAGVSVLMDYSPSNSSAGTYDVEYAMITNWDYDIAARYKFKSVHDADWETMLRAELNKGLPLIYRGNDEGGAGGHAWVCDGYDDSNNTFHMNWGWGGYDNGFFALTALNAGTYNFVNSQGAIFGLTPNLSNTKTLLWEHFDLDDAYFDISPGWNMDGDGDGVNYGGFSGGYNGSYSKTGNGGKTNQWIVSPKKGLPAGNTINLSFYAHRTFTASQEIEVYISTTGTDVATDFTLLESFSITDPWLEYNTDLSAYAGQKIYVALKCKGNDANFSFIYIDDVSITAIPNGIATISTNEVSTISYATATGNGNITNLGFPNPTAHGFCWSVTPGPSISSSNTNEGAVSATGAFTSSITGLLPDTKYYIRAYATNSAGTSYGEARDFTTLAYNTTEGVTFNSSQTQKVLFLGNSYTYYNSMPSLLSQIATSTGNTLIYDSETPGGATFYNHSISSTAETKINSNDWDFVVLQGQSQEPAFSVGNNITHVNTIRDKMIANDNCSEMLLFMTWGRENGDATMCPGYSQFCTYESMDNAIYDSYMYYMENLENTQMSPVGKVWRYLRTNHPSLDLYFADGSHPSITGSYAAAVTFYTMIFKKDPTLISFESTLSSADAIIIKNAVKTVVFDEMAIWVNEELDFDFANGPLSLILNPLTEQDGVFNWEFGDGNTSTQTSPTHDYATIGTYDVSMQRAKCGDTLTIEKSIDVISEANYGQTCEYPYILHKPASGDTIFEVDNTTGNKYYSYTAQNDEIIDFSSWCTTDRDTWLHVYRNSCGAENLVHSANDDRFFQNEFVGKLSAGETFIFVWDDTNNSFHTLIFDAKFSVADYNPITDCNSAPTAVEGQNKIYIDDEKQYYTFTAPNNGSLNISTLNTDYKYSMLPINLLESCGGSTIATHETTNFRTYLQYDNVEAGESYIIELGILFDSGVPLSYECQVEDYFDFTFTPEEINYDALSICEGDSIFLQGAWQKTQGTYTDTYTDISGNDSIVETTLTLNPIYDITEDIVICTGGDYTLPDGTLVNTAGTYISNLFTLFGCDSIITTYITVNEIFRSLSEVEVCSGASYILPDGTEVSTEGTYISNLIAGTGCDSIVTTNLTITSGYNSSENISICDGEIYVLPNGTEVSVADTYTSNLLAVGGCDSIVTTNLTVYRSYNSIEDIVICSGETYILPSGIEASTQGNYTSNLLTVNGCDSVITTNLTINPSYNLSENVSICAGSIYTLPNGKKVNSAGTYKSEFLTFGGCDSIITTNLSINPSYKININASICDGDTYTLHDGTELSSEGIYISNLLSHTGCDSIIVTNLILNSSNEINLFESICEGENVQIGEKIFTEAGKYTVNLINQFGCDSVINLDLTVNMSDETYLYDTICEGESLQVAYAVFSGTGLYGVTLTNQFGCDSVIYIDLYENKNNTTVNVNGNELTVESDADSYQWINCDLNNPIEGETNNSFTANESGNYAVIIENNGCIDTAICNSVIISGIEEHDRLIQSIWPNPTSGQLNVHLGENNTPIEISIYDITGKLILLKEIAINETYFTTEIPGESGIYLLQVKSNSRASTFKIIKR